MQKQTKNKLLNFLLISAAAAIAYFLLQKTFFLLFPIFLAYLFSEGIRKSLDRLSPLAKTAKQILTVLLLLIFFSLLSLIAVLLAERFLHYTTKGAELLSAHIDDITSFCKEQIHRLERALSPIFKKDLENRFTLYLPSLFENLLKKGLEMLPKWIGGMASFLPRFFISLIIFLVSCYYFSCDWERIRFFAESHISPARRQYLSLGKKHFFRSLKQYSRAYFLLFLLSFSQLFLGLTLLRTKNAFGTALIIALIDLLPVLGCGTVLIPWSLFSFLAGQTGMGIGLLILYLVTLLVHQFAEPKIIGSSIGLHPILSLVLVILGLRLLGVWGMILFPLGCTCFFKVNQELRNQSENT